MGGCSFDSFAPAKPRPLVRRSCCICGSGPTNIDVAKFGTVIAAGAAIMWVPHPAFWVVMHAPDGLYGPEGGDAWDSHLTAKVVPEDDYREMTALAGEATGIIIELADLDPDESASELHLAVSFAQMYGFDKIVLAGVYPESKDDTFMDLLRLRSRDMTILSATPGSQINDILQPAL